MDLDEAVRRRRSVRGFRSDPVPRETIRDIFALAQRAPSNCNVQPWKVFLASGEARDRLRERLVEAMEGGKPSAMEVPIDDFHGAYRERQVACAVEMYGHMGVRRGDREGRFRAHMRNFELFDAPHVALICMDRAFGIGVALDVGMYVQTLMLLLVSRGIGSCAQASLRAYPEISAEVLGVPDHLRILCGLSFGYEDPTVPANATRQPRLPVEESVVFVDRPAG